MHDWRSKIERKRLRGSQTPGSQKTLACQATALERFFAKRSRSYKHQGYAEWVGYMTIGSSKIKI